MTKYHSRKFPGKTLHMGRRESAVLSRFAMQNEHVTYDFSKDAGAVGTISFGKMLPASAVITEVYSDELTNVTSGGAATVQLFAGATALTDAEAYTAYAGTQERALAASATAIKLSTTASSELKMTIAAAAVTAGKVTFTITYFDSYTY